MEKKIKKSVATLLAHIIKIDQRDIAKEAPLFCKLMAENYACTQEEAEAFLRQTMEEDYNLDENIALLNDTFGDDRLTKMHILEQVNHIIYSDKISSVDYEEFEKIKDALLPSEY